MSFINTKRVVVAGALAFGTIAGVGAAAIAGPAQDVAQQPAANAVQAPAQTQNVPEVRITSGDYALEYRVLNTNGDGFGSTMDPNTTRDVQGDGFSTVDFFVAGKHINRNGPLVDGSTLACQATGTAEAPEVRCDFE
ncbi:hypothetical protein [Saccharopolyspora tripterygii]